jgi:hypothetical protein
LILVRTSDTEEDKRGRWQYHTESRTWVYWRTKFVSKTRLPHPSHLTGPNTNCCVFGPVRCDGCGSLDCVYYNIHRSDTPTLVEDEETLKTHSPTQVFVISMNNDTDWKAGEYLKWVFGITNMHVVLGHVSNESTLSLYNHHLMRHDRTDTLQIGNLNMLRCLESYREVWTRVQHDSYVFEDDTVQGCGGGGCHMDLSQKVWLSKGLIIKSRSLNMSVWS